MSQIPRSGRGDESEDPEHPGSPTGGLPQPEAPPASQPVEPGAPFQGVGYSGPPGAGRYPPPPYRWPDGPPLRSYGAPSSGGGTLLADYSSRVVAFILDALIVGIPVVIIALAGGLGRLGNYTLDSLGAFAYATLFIGAIGQTLGMRVMQIGVATATDGVSHIGYGRAALRAAIAFLIRLIVLVGPLIDLLWPLWDPTNQTLHDKAAGTVVVRR